MRDNACQQRGLDGQIFGYCLNHPIAVGKFGQVVVEVAGGDQRGQRGVVECRRFGLAKGLKRADCKLVPHAFAGGNHVEQQRRNAGVGQVRGDAGAHGSGTQDGRAANQKRQSNCGKRRCGR